MSLTQTEIKLVLLGFDWGNYGLDDLDRRVNPGLSEDWADDLSKLLAVLSDDSAGADSTE